MKNSLSILVGILLLISFSVQAQLSKDAASQDIAEKVLNYIYNHEFSKAKPLVAGLAKKYPKHPVIPFLKAYQLSWEKFPLQKGSPEFTYYNQYLQLSAQYSRKILEKDKNNLEGKFFNMMVYGLLAMHEAYGGDFLQSVSFGKKSFAYMKDGFELTDEYPDFHFSTGLYRYFAVQYPETHPAAKPFMIFFPGGDKQNGLWHLQQAEHKSRFARVEAFIYLNAIYAKFENNNLLALNYAQKLINQYPKNPFFWMKYCEALIFVGRLAEAEIYLSKFNFFSGNLYKTGNQLFKGLIQERYYKNTAKAKTFYSQVIAQKDYDERYAQDYVAMAYAGLARIAQAGGNDKLAKSYYKKSLKLTEYESLIKEAKAYLKS